MAKYRFFKKNKYSRKVEIRRERVEFDSSALFICLAAAILVWLYVAGTHLQNTEKLPQVNEPAETEEVTVGESDAGEVTENSGDMTETAPAE